MIGKSKYIVSKAAWGKLISQGAKFLYFLLISVLFFSCEKVIDVDLNDAAKTIVIEGRLTDNPEFAQVKISKTSSYFDGTPGEKITGATVTIETEDGENILLPEVEKGIYKTRRVPLKNKGNYTLTVNAEGEIYKATSRLNPPVFIDSLSYYYEDKLSFFDDGYAVQVFFTDPANVENYYRVRVIINSEIQSDIDNLFVFNDKYVDGQQLQITLREKDFSLNDVVTIQLISLDKNVYEFYKTFEELLSNNPGSAAPANPTSNLSNGALGYFSAYLFDTKSIAITE